MRTSLVAKRKKAGLRQTDLAKRLKRRQDYVSYVETGQKLIEVVELMEWAEATGFDAKDAIKALAKIRAHGSRPRRARLLLEAQSNGEPLCDSKARLSVLARM